MARVFVSHASGDRVLAGEVHRWLIGAGHEVFLAQDLRDGITVGEQWERRLHERLRWADAVVCVVTSAYLASRWCAAEVATAVSRGSRLLPVHAEPGVTDPLLTSVQHADIAQDPGAARVKLVEALRRVDMSGGLGWPDGRCAFPGLRPFHVDEHRVFFGRTGEIAQLAALLRSVAERVEAAALLVVGPSGCGKSSLVRAGLVPVMADEPGWWALAPMLPGADPVAALVRELAAGARRVGLDWTVAQVRQRLDEAGLTELADELLLEVSGGRRLLVVVDQFEELLTQTGSAARARFARLLGPALSGPVQVVATLRPEFLSQLLVDPELAALPTRTSTLRPLCREALRGVIEGPARLAGIGADDGLVARLVADTDTGEALPLLAFTLAQLAEGVGCGGQLSAVRYEQLGGVQGALTRQADAALADAITAGRRGREEVIGGLLRLVSVDEQGRPTRWRVLRNELPDPVAVEWDAFIARRLLVTDTNTAKNGNGTVVVGVAHEAFLSAWPPLAEAITARGPALRACRAIERAATEWDQDGRMPGRLWERGQLAAALADTGARLHSVGRSPAVTPTDPSSAPGTRQLSRWWPQRRRILVTDHVELSPKARAFLHASIRRDRRQRGRATTILSALLILALIAAGVALIQRQVAQEQQRVATARQLVAQAEATRASDPRTALLLGIAALRIHADSQTRTSLVTTLTTTRYAGTLTGRTGSVIAVAFSPDGRTLATAGEDGTVKLWDAATHRLIATLTGHTNMVKSVAFSPDGRTLATGDYNGTVILWDLTNPTRPTHRSPPVTGYTNTNSVVSLAFSPDGHNLLTASVDSTITLWDLTDPTRPTRGSPSLNGYTSAVISAAFSPDRRTLAISSEDGTVTLWDLTDPTRPTRRGPPLIGHTGQVASMAFSPDGHALATGGFDKTVILWDLTDPARPARRGPPLIGHTSAVESVAFSLNGTTLVTGSADQTVQLWNVTDLTRPTRRGPSLIGHTSFVNTVAFSPDERTLASASSDKTVILWDLTDLTRPAPRNPPLTGSVVSVAFSPDGRTLATVHADGTVILWDLTDLARPTRRGSPLTGHTSAVDSVAFSPDGRTLAAASRDDGTVILWDLTDLTRPIHRNPPLTGSAVAFSPDGRTLATANAGDDTFTLWDLTDLARPTHRSSPLTRHTSGMNSVAVHSVAFSPDGRTLATASSSDGTIILWDLTDLTRPTRRSPPLTGHTSPVDPVAFSPDGRTLASAGDGTIILWDLTDLTRPTRRGSPLTGHTHGVNSLAFSPDGRTLATASAGDTTVILWDPTDPTRPTQIGAPLSGHTDVVWSVAFSSDGRTLATASFDRTGLLWDLTGLNYLRDHATERACSITGRGLDHDEWARHIPGLAYQNTCPV